MLGIITLEDIYSAVPWPSTIDVIKVNGATLRSILEHSVRNYDPYNEDPGGKFLQLSGLIVHYNISKPQGERVVSVKVGQPDQQPELESLPSLVDINIYSVAMPSYLIGGGDGYSMIPKSLVHHKNTGFLMQDLVTHFVEHNSPIHLPTSGRIVFESKIPTMVSTSSSTTSPRQMKTSLHYAYAADIVLLAIWLYLC